jgi:twinkle protein
MADIREISSMLNDRAEQVASMLLPNGRLVKREWCVGSVHGEPGMSLKVCVSGDKVGVWSDFAAGVSGDLIDQRQCVQRKNILEL